MPLPTPAEAEALIRGGQKGEALFKLRAALGNDPRNVQANRLTAQLLDAQGDPRALEYYRFVVLEDEVLPYLRARTAEILNPTSAHPG